MDTYSSSSKKKFSLKKFILPVFLLVVAIGVGTYFASKAGLDKALFKQALDTWIEQSEKRAAADGLDLSIAYDEVTIAGGFITRHAIIHNLRVTQTTLQQTPTKVVYRTAVVKFLPNSHDFKNFTLQLPAPLEKIENGQGDVSASLVSETPLVIEVRPMTLNGENYQQIRHKLSPKITIKHLVGQEAIGAEEATPSLTPRYESIEITSENGIMNYLANDKTMLLAQASFAADNIRIVPIGNEQKTISIAAISSNFEDNLNPKKNNKMTLDFSLDNLVANDEYIANTPISLMVNFAYVGAKPETPEQLAAATPQQTSFKLSNFALHTKAAKLDATADFVTSSDDILPVGTATVTMTDLPAWRKILADAQLSDIKTEEVANTFLLRTVGERLVDATDVTLDINRARGGTFEVGKVTLEEVMAIVFGGMRTPLDSPAPAAVLEKPAEKTTPSMPKNQAEDVKPDAEKAQEVSTPAPAKASE
ncbi:MAG: hypothetical protein ACK5WQ_07625 [Alphaproteobacteria bacterium]